jgi:D-alanyl-lipoteichoic acid acyltransferase DltB (MBOAT superfamily)
LLPVGISFYTFQTISYSIDIYRKEIKPVRNIIDFGFFVSFFPQLVAGPIVRAKQFIPQIYKEYNLTKAEFGLAIFWILKGLVKKVYIGDYIAVNFVDRVFSNPTHYTGFENLMAMFGYSLQVYVDFSGYTDMAIGIALLMGFTLPINFNSPYKAMNVAGFWKRWHISLSSWLKDYLYIPMGGNRNGSLFSYITLSIALAFIVLLSGIWWLSLVFIAVIIVFVIIALKIPSFKKAVNTNINLMLTMLIGGLWHGASWQFVIWGGLNGIGLVVFKFWRQYKKSQYIFLAVINITLITLFALNVLDNHLFRFLMILLNSFWLISFLISLGHEKGKQRNWYQALFSIILTFSFITFTRVFFRGQSMPLVGDMLTQISNNFSLTLIPEILVSYKWVFSVMTIGFVFHWLPEKIKEGYKNWFIGLPYWAQAVVSAIVVFIVYQSVSADMQSFIYFQF